jgi:hypothetical protein
MEELKLSCYIIAYFLIFAFVNNDDYHKIFDKPQIIRYNCDVLMGGWHPDVPAEVIKQCRELKKRVI